MRHKLAAVAPVVASVSAVLSVFVLLWSYVASEVFPPITFGPNPGYAKPKEGRAGEYVYLCRDITVTRGVTLTIERAYTTNNYPQNGELAIAMPAERVSRSPGSVSQCRVLQIPYGIPTGHWELRTWVTYTSWPFWTRTIEAPVVGLEVVL